MSLFVFLFAGILPSGSAAPANTPCQPGVPRALVLSGGGSKGAFEAGAMYHLIVHRGCDFVDIAGVSVGGLNASYVGAAPMGPDSLANLQRATRDLAKLWRMVPGPQQFLTKRFLGPVRMAIFGIESLYDFAPARKWIDENIHPSKIRESGRNVRIGTVNFYDGTYHEITPGSSTPWSSRDRSPELKKSLDLYRNFVLGGALMPVFGEMPRIPKNQDPDSENWPQYADGGLRHQTPVAGYFIPCEVVPLVPRPECRDNSLPVHEAVRELMIVMSSPYDQASDKMHPPRCCPADKKRRHVKDGREILERTVMDIVLDSPYRWDVGFAIVANGALKWRAELYEKVCKTPTEACDIFKKNLKSHFPVESTNKDKDLDGFSLPYKMGIASPEEILTDSYDFDPTQILKQLRLGCVAANKMMERYFGATDTEEMTKRCNDDFNMNSPQLIRSRQAARTALRSSSD